MSIDLEGISKGERSVVERNLEDSFGAKPESTDKPDKKEVITDDDTETKATKATTPVGKININPNKTQGGEQVDVEKEAGEKDPKALSETVANLEKAKEPKIETTIANQLPSTDGKEFKRPDRFLERAIFKDIGMSMPFPENTNDDVVVDDKKSAPYNINKRLIDSYGVGNLENRNGVLYANYKDGELHRVTDYNGNYVLKDGSVIDKDGNAIVAANDQTALSNRFRDGIFEWMDTYGADSLTPDKLRTIMHEEGRDGWKAYRKTNNNMGNIAFAGEMLRELKKEYFSSKPERAAAANAIDVNYMDGTVPTSLKDKNDNAISVDAIEALDFIKKAQAITGKNGYIASHLDPKKTLELQKLCKEYSDKNGGLISQFLKEGEEFKIDGVYGNQTGTVFTGLLSMLPNELLNSAGLKRYPDGSINKAEYSDEWLSNDLENNKLSKDKEFDLKRNRRIRNLQGFMSILANIGDTIKGAGGANVEDRREEINNVFDKIDKQYDAINSDYNARIDALQKSQREESDKRKQWQLKLAEMEITHQMNKELRGLDFANQMAALVKQQEFQSNENVKNMNFQAGQRAADRKNTLDIASLRSETSGDKNKEVLFYYNGKDYYVDKNKKDAILSKFNSKMRDIGTLTKLGLSFNDANTIQRMAGGVAGNAVSDNAIQQALSFIIEKSNDKEALEKFIAEGVFGYVEDGSKEKSNTGTEQVAGNGILGNVR